MKPKTEQIKKIEEKAPKNIVNSVQKAIKILECFTTKHSELSLSQICRYLSLPKSTTLNLIKTLEINGYLIKVSGANYRLGYKLMELSYNLRSSLPIIQYSTPFLEEIQVKTGENIYLTSHLNGRVLYLEGMHPSIRIGNYSIAGKTLPMHCTGCGKAMLAYLPLDEVAEIIKTWGLEKCTENTITSADELFIELEHIKKRGYSIDLEEETLGVKCIGMAIRDSKGYPTGAISISGTVMSIKDELLEDYAKMLSRVCSVFITIAEQFPAGQIRSKQDKI